MADIRARARRLRDAFSGGHGSVPALYLRDEGLQRLADDLIFAKAVRETRIILTFDLDFGEIAARCDGPWTSVIVFRLANATATNVITRLDAALRLASHALDYDVIVVVEESRIRIRGLPVDGEDDWEPLHGAM
jgi:predicted nuclease of predicted toxin-antitoxin system